MKDEDAWSNFFSFFKIYVPLTNYPLELVIISISE